MIRGLFGLVLAWPVVVAFLVEVDIGIWKGAWWW